MRRALSLLLAGLVCFVLLAACGNSNTVKTYHDGVYTAEFKEFDPSYGYKDFIRVTVEDGVITKLEYDAVNEQGGLKSKDADYEKRMDSQKDTYPSRYSADLVNQLLEKGSLDAVDAVAGATWSSECFKALFTALEPQMVSGNTDHLLVDNILPY